MANRLREFFGIESTNCRCSNAYQESLDAIAKKLDNRKEYDKMNNKDKIMVYVDGEVYRPCVWDTELSYNGNTELSLKVFLTERYKIAETASKSTLIKKVHFNPPATVVLWADGSKTVVKAQEGDDYDPEKGLAMAISKKALGNKGNFNDVFKKHLELYYEEQKKSADYMDKLWKEFYKTLGFAKFAINTKDSDGE